MLSFRYLMILCVGLFSLSSRSVPADEVTLTPVADTTLWERQPSHNLGGAGMLPVGTIGEDGDSSRSHLLLKFDIAGGLPVNAEIQSATLKIHQLRSPGTSVNRTFRGYTVLFDWGEGDKTYGDPQTPLQNTDPATLGEATWVDRMFGVPGSAWLSEGGGIDEDFGDDTNFEFFSQSGSDRDYERALTLSGVDTLKSWLSSPGLNFGWAIVVDNGNIPFSARQIASRENVTPEYRPQLTITYTVPGPASPDIQTISRIGDVVTVDYSAEAGVVYRPQYKSTVNGSGWTDLPDQGPLSADDQLQFTDDVSGVDERYYQVIIPSP